MATHILSRACIYTFIDIYTVHQAPRGLIPDPLLGVGSRVSGLVVALNVCGVNKFGGV